MKSLRLLLKEKFKLRLILNLVLSLAFSFLFIIFLYGDISNSFLHTWRERLNDIQRSSMPKHTKSGAVVIVDIDDKSISKLGMWPWPRDRVAELVEKIYREYGANAVALDILYSEDAQPSDKDLNLWNVSTKYPLIFSHVFGFSEDRKIQIGVLPEGYTCTSKKTKNATSNIGIAPGLAIFQPSVGHISSITDVDGVMRRVIPVVSYNSLCFNALSLAVLDTIAGYESSQNNWIEGNYYIEQKGTGIKLPLNYDGSIPIQFTEDGFQYVSAVDILDEKLTINSFKNQIVLIGSSAVGLGDLVTTSKNNSLPGVEIHANIIDMAIRGNNFVRTDWSILLTAAFVFFLLMLLFGSVGNEKNYKHLGFILAGSLIWLIIVYWSWMSNIEIYALPVILALVLIPFKYGISYVVVEFKEQRLLMQFSAYLPREVLDELVKTGDDPRRLSAKRKDITVIFVDICGFTKIAENLPPEKLALMLNIVLDNVSRIIASYGGTLDKFIGDAVMAFWGAPAENTKHADAAFKCAISIQKNVNQINKALVRNNLPEISLSIGINSGIAAVGNMGSKSRRAYTAIGDVVNIAARLQELCKDLNKDILVGEETCRRIEEGILFPLGKYEVRGRRVKIIIATPVYEDGV